MVKNILHDNTADENVTKLIWVCIVFVVGAILLLLVTTAFKDVVATWYNKTMESWFNEQNGGFDLEGKTTGN